jgi:hypothetical protein
MNLGRRISAERHRVPVLERIIDYVVSEFRTEQGIDLRNDKMARH